MREIVLDCALEREKERMEIKKNVKGKVSREKEIQLWLRVGNSLKGKRKEWNVERKSCNWEGP